MPIHLSNRRWNIWKWLSLLCTLWVLAFSPTIQAFDAPPKDQGHTGPNAGGNDPNNPNGPNQGEGGDPIHIRGGNFTTSQEDLLILGHGMPLLMKRSYNSHDNYFEGPFGFGWSFSYHVTAIETVDGDGKAQVTVRDGDGVDHIFIHQSGNQFDPPLGRYNKLVKIGARAYEVTRKDAVKLVFNEGRLNHIVDLNGNQLTLAYAADGKLSSITSPSGRSLQFAYGANNKISTVTGPLGRSVQYQYNANGDLTHFINAAGDVTQYSYDSNHHLLTVVDANGSSRLVNTYDSEGRVTQQLSDGRLYRYRYETNWTRVQDPSGRFIYHYFNDQGNTIRRTDQLGSNEFYSYDAQSNLTGYTDAKGIRTVYTYDDLGNVTTITDAKNQTTTFVNHPQFNVLTEVTDSLGRKTLFEYDAKGNLTQKTDANGGVTKFEYNALGQIVKTTDESGKNIFLSYAVNGDLTGITNHRGEQTQLEYDAAGRRTKSIDPLGHATSYVYDAMDRLTRLTNPLGQSITYNYDKLGNLTKVADPNNHAIQFNYDQYGLSTSVVDQEGYITSYAYDANGNMASVTDPLGNIQTSNFDVANRLISISRADGSVTGFAYDRVGNNVQITDPLGYQTKFIYDSLNRLTTSTYADNTTETRTYDEVGNISIFRDRMGRDFNYTYDNLDRVTKQTLPSAEEETISFDAIGFVSAVTNKHGTIQYAFDNADRLASITDVFGKVTQYEYDAAGRRTKSTDPDGVITQYIYDNANRLTQVNRQGAITQFSYDAAGRLLSRVLPNGVVSEYSYDKRDLITQLVHKKADASIIASFHYEYDATGKRTKVTEADGSTVEYLYDTVYQLINETKKANDGAVLYVFQHEYDLNGNRTKYTGGSVIDYTYNNLNQIVSDSNTTYEYDANGNLLKETQGSQITSYEYDDENQLVKISYPDGSQLTSKYDAEGKRIEHTDAAGIKRYQFDGTAVASETDNTGSNIVRYNRSLGIISANRGGTKHYYLTDALGSVRLLLDNNGNVTDTYTYDAFGNLLQRTGSTDNAYTFAGNWGYYDLGGLSHVGARYYSPKLARFLTLDPLYQGSNWYSYALNDPVNLVDPDGRWVHIGIGAGIGALVNTGIYLYSTPRSQWSLGGGVRAAATGAIVGGVGAATFGASMPATLGGAVARGAVSGLAGQAAADLTNSAIDQKLQISSPWTYGGAAVTGGALSGLGYGASRAWQAWRGAPKGTCCFVAGTPVVVPEGYKNIEDIRVGDLVLAKNVDTGEQEFKPVTKLYKKHRRIYALTVLDTEGVELVIETTDDHPFYVSGRGWVNVIDLQIGDQLESANRDWVVVTGLSATQRFDTTYNLEVGQFHTYYATHYNLLVHNCNGTKGGFRDQMSPEEAARYDEYWQRYAPDQVTPGTTRMDHTRISGRTGRVEDSRVIYDKFGRQRYRVDKTDHMRPENHSNPHLHERTYNPSPQNPIYNERRYNF